MALDLLERFDTLVGAVTVSNDDLTLAILRDIQARLSSHDRGFASFEEKLDVVSERLSMVERGVTFCTAQINVMRRRSGVDEKQTDDEIRDLQVRVARLEDLVKP